MNVSDRKILSRANNEKSYASGGHLQRDGSKYPTSNPEIPMKNPATKKCGGVMYNKRCKGGGLKKMQIGGTVPSFVGPNKAPYEIDSSYLESMGYDSMMDDAIPSSWMQSMQNASHYTVNSDPNGNVMFDADTGKYYFSEPLASGMATPTSSPIDYAVLGVGSAATRAAIGTAKSLYSFGKGMEGAQRTARPMPQRAGGPRLLKPPQGSATKPLQPPTTGGGRPMPQQAGGPKLLGDGNSNLPIPSPNWIRGGNPPTGGQMVPYAPTSGQMVPYAPATYTRPMGAPLYAPYGSTAVASMGAKSAASTQQSEKQAEQFRTGIPISTIPEATSQIADQSPDLSIAKREAPAETAPPTSLSFADAFSFNRRMGANEFEWNGGLYHTRTKEEEQMRIAQEASKASPLLAMQAKDLTSDVDTEPLKKSKTTPVKESKKEMRKRHTNDRKETRKGANILYDKASDKKKYKKDARDKRKGERNA